MLMLFYAGSNAHAQTASRAELRQTNELIRAQHVRTFATIAEMIAGPATNSCRVLSYAGTNGLGGGEFVLRGTNGYATNMGWVFASTAPRKFWVRVADKITPYQFGAVGDLTADDTDEFQWAIQFAASPAGAGVNRGRMARVTVQDGQYGLNGTRGGVVVSNGVEIVGESQMNTVLFVADVWTNDVFRVAEADDGDPNTSAKIALRNFSVKASGFQGTNISVFNLTGCRSSRISDIYVEGAGITGGLNGVTLSDTNKAGGSESCFFNRIEYSTFGTVRALVVLKNANNNNGVNKFEGITGTSSNVYNTLGVAAFTSAGIKMEDIYMAATTTNCAEIIGVSPEGITIIAPYGAEGYVKDPRLSEWGHTQHNYIYGFSIFDGLIVPPGYALSLQGQSPILPDAFADKFFTGTWVITTNSGTNVSVQMFAPASAYNVHRVSLAGGDVGTALGITNTGSTHTEYAYINTNSLGNLAYRYGLGPTTNGSELVIARVTVNASGVITGLTNDVPGQLGPVVTARAFVGDGSGLTGHAFKSGNGTIAVIGTNSFTVNTNGDFTLTLGGAGFHGQRISGLISNYNTAANNIVVTLSPDTYDVMRGMVTNILYVPSNSISALEFQYDTNFVGGGRWVLLSQSKPQYALLFGNGVMADTNVSALTITVAVSLGVSNQLNWQTNSALVSGGGGALTNFVIFEGQKTRYISGATNQSIVFMDAGEYSGVILSTNRTATPRPLSINTATNNPIPLGTLTLPYDNTNAVWFTYYKKGSNVWYAIRPVSNPP